MCMRKLFTFVTLIALLPRLHLAQCAEKPERIVSLGTYVTENLHLLGADDAIVAVTAHEKPLFKKGREIIGTLLEPNVEKIVLLEPDLVIASKEGNRPQSVRKMRDVGLTVVVLEELFGFDDICGNFLRLGDLLAKRQEARRIVARQRNRLSLLRTSRKTGDYRPSVFLCVGRRPLFTTGTATYLHEMLDRAGARNLFGDIDKKYSAVNIEEVVRRNPDVIIELSMGTEKPAPWERFPEMKAVRENRVFSVNPELFCSPTPASFVDAVERIAEMAHMRIP